MVPRRLSGSEDRRNYAAMSALPSKADIAMHKPMSAKGQKQTFVRQDRNSMPVDLPFCSATIIQVSVEEAAMATRKKAKGKHKAKRKKSPISKTTRRKTPRKARTTSKNTAKKKSLRSASIK